MKRIGYRHLLPPFALVVYAALVWFGCPDVGQWRRGAVPECSMAGWSPADQAAYGLNLPAVVAWSLVDPLVQPRERWTCVRGALIQHFGTGLLAPVLWYLVGRRVDRWNELRTRPYGRGGRIAARVGVSALAAACLIVVGVVLIGVGDMTYGLFQLAWALFGLTVIVSRLRGTARVEVAG